MHAETGREKIEFEDVLKNTRSGVSKTINIFQQYEGKITFFKTIRNVSANQNRKTLEPAQGQKQVDAAFSNERRVLEILAVNAEDSNVPPNFVLHRIQYMNIFVRCSLNKSIPGGNSSGWVTEKEFVKFMDHSIKHVLPQKNSLSF
ncbi:hypothetical protein NPIL_228811 [Nephila pilipes]|uniref:Uncharacterized protein n=1 Tax=Nephila pilipes TaxID=299642 RepID=A0A8X6P1A0_NEPPI|nr:hypothetical protein NPIL_228811 [Nephila pilipes]